MYQNILLPIAVDHERDVHRALSVARALAGDGAKITALNVIDLLPSYATEYLQPDHLDSQIDGVRNALLGILGDAPDVNVVVVQGHSGRTIVDYATENGIDLIAIASHRPGLQDYFLGSTAARVVRHAPCAVHVVR